LWFDACCGKVRVAAEKEAKRAAQVAAEEKAGKNPQVAAEEKAGKKSKRGKPKEAV
jgi:hypothetical protein